MTTTAISRYLRTRRVDRGFPQSRSRAGQTYTTRRWHLGTRRRVRSGRVWYNNGVVRSSTRVASYDMAAAYVRSTRARGS